MTNSSSKQDLERNVREIEEERILLRALVGNSNATRSNSSGSKSRLASKQSRGGGRRRSEGSYGTKKTVDVQRSVARGFIFAVYWNIYSLIGCFYLLFYILPK